MLAFVQAYLYKFNPVVSRSTFDYLTCLLMTCLLHYLAIVINKNRSQHVHTRQKNNTLELKQEKYLNTLAFVHEIRQPLSCLLMESQLLHLKSSKWQIPDEEKTMIDHLHERSKEINNTIKSIESLAMDSRNKKKPIDLSQVVLAAIKYNESTIFSNSIELSFNQGNFPYIISGDHYQLLILVRNVLTNSINSVVKNQHLERSIKISIMSSDHCISLTIADNGLGFNPSIISRNFRFSYKPEGMGAGIPIINSIAKEHQANVYYGSCYELGGALVKIKFPQKITLD